MHPSLRVAHLLQTCGLIPSHYIRQSSRLACARTNVYVCYALWYRRGRMVLRSLRTFCLAVLHGVQAIVDTLPAVRRFRWGVSPPPPEPPRPPPPLPSDVVAGVAPRVLELSASFAEEEEEDSGCLFEGAKERNADMLWVVTKRFPRYGYYVGYSRDRERGLNWDAETAVVN